MALMDQVTQTIHLCLLYHLELQITRKKKKKKLVKKAFIILYNSLIIPLQYMIHFALLAMVLTCKSERRRGDTVVAFARAFLIESWAFCRLNWIS